MFLANSALVTMVFLLGSCATPLSCWKPQDKRAPNSDEALVLQLQSAQRLEQLDAVRNKLDEGSDVYLLYLYHLKRSDLEVDEKLKLAFANYATELKEIWPSKIICEQGQ